MNSGFGIKKQNCHCEPKAKQSLAIIAVLLTAFLSACSDYAGKIEDNYKEQFGDKEKYFENLNKVDADLASICESGAWFWCATQNGEYNALNKGFIEQYSSGDARFTFMAIDDNSYDYSTNTLNDDLLPYLRYDGGITVKVTGSGDFKAGLKINTGDYFGELADNNVVIAYENDCPGVKVNLDLVPADDAVVWNDDVIEKGTTVYRFSEDLLISDLQVLTLDPDQFTVEVGDTDWKTVAAEISDGEKSGLLTSVITIEFTKSCVDGSRGVNLIGVGLVPTQRAGSSSSNGGTAKSSSSNKGGTTTSSNSTEKVELAENAVTCEPEVSQIKVGESVKWKFTLSSEAIRLITLSAINVAHSEWTLDGGKPSTSAKDGPSTVSSEVTYSTSGTKKASLDYTARNYHGTFTCSTLEVVENETASSSSSAKSSSSATPDPVTGFLWDGYNKSDFVQTDFGSGNKWYIFTDADTDSGSTVVSVPEVNPYDVCQGKCIAVSFGELVGNDERQPYAGVGFDLGEGGATYDVSGWQGICIAYQSVITITGQGSAELRVDLRPYDPNYYGYNIPSYSLPISATGGGTDYRIENILWSDFAQRWSGTEELSGPEVATMLRGISITLESYPNRAAYLNIYQIGSYGQCGNVKAKSVDIGQFKFPESSSSAESSSSNGGDEPSWTCGPDDMWCGPGVYRVETGLDAGDGASGYWFSYTDDANGGKSKIDWPVERGNEYSSDAFDPVIDYCGGLCGTYTLTKGTLEYDPYVGVGFSIAGTKDDSSEPVPADASGWGGVCVTYMVDHPAYLILDLGTAKNTELADDKPRVALPESSNLYERCLAWSEFEQAGWGVSSGGTTISGYKASKILVYLNFEIQASDGSTGNFKITRVRKFPEARLWGSCTVDKESAAMDEGINFTFTPDLTGSYTASDFANAVYYWNFGDLDSQAGVGQANATKSYYEKGTYNASVEVVMPDERRQTIECVPTITIEEASNPAWDYLNPAFEYGEFTDERDGQVYKTVVIGKQVWMAQNLNYAYLAGTAELDSSSFCYNNDPDSCAKYGRSYLWSAAMDSSMVFSTTTGIGCGYYDTCSVVVPYQGICPAGWRLPSKNDWEILFNYVGDGENVGSVLKTKTGWGLILGDSYNSYNGTDDYGFSANPTAYRGGNGKYGIEADAYFWSSHQDHHTVWLRGGDNRLSVSYNGASPNEAISVRCVHDLVEKPLSGSFIDERDGRTYNFVKIGNQTWMAQNLNYATESRRCYAGLDDTASCNLYGGLYTWADAVGYSDDECGYGYNCKFESQIQGICPNGWHMPSRAEFATLAEDVGGYGGLMLKSTTGWHYWDEGYDGLDALGFNGIPTGVWTRGEYGKPDNMAYTAVYWAATETNAYEARYMLLRDRSKSIELMYEYKDNYYSVRCVQDED